MIKRAEKIYKIYVRGEFVAKCSTQKKLDTIIERIKLLDKTVTNEDITIRRIFSIEV